MSVSKTTVIGHLGKDCTVNVVNGKNVINFNVAHSEKYKSQEGNMVEKTTWFQCAYWTDKTGIAPYLKKGTMVYAEGQVSCRTYAGSDGVTKASLELRVFSVNLLAQPKETTAGASAPQGGAYIPPTQHSGGYEPVDDLPPF